MTRIAFAIALLTWSAPAMGASIYAQSIEEYSSLAADWPAGAELNILSAPDAVFVDFDGVGGQPGYVTISFGNNVVVDGPGSDVIIHLQGDWDPPESFYTFAGDGTTWT
jgi:hypothetical protein